MYWTAAASPIIVERDLEAPVGIALAIDPGVDAGLAPRTTITISRQLYAAGTPEAPVRFAGGGKSERSPPTRHATMPYMETLELATTVYGDYAAVYDRSGQMRFSVLMDMYLREVLLHHPSPGRRMLDLACGTGTLALMQAEASWDVTGLDLAAPMLEEARRKQQTAGVQASFVQGDMRDFELGAPVDLVTCCYDSLNYLLSEEELLSCFRSIYRSLVPGGLCCFDLATEYFLRHYWQGVEVHEADGYSEVMASSFDDATGRSTLVLTGFIQAGLGSYRRFREVHVERSYAPADVERLLRHARLVPAAFYDCFTFQTPNAQSLRHFWVVRKGTGDGERGTWDGEESWRLPTPDLEPPTPGP